MRFLGFLVNVLAGLTGVGAGIYLLAQWSESGPTWLEVIAHGSGAFFIGCGLYMIGSSILAAAER
jgi:threonine/homoserine/homoserine lactone efflux protein